MPSVFHLVALGANGDCLNALMLAKHLSTMGEVQFIVSKTYAPILDGFSYVNPIIWPYEYSRLPECLHWLKRHGIHKPIVCQSYTHPDSRKELPYQLDSYRIAGHQNLFGTLPLVIDRRNKDREYSLMEKLPIGKLWVGVCVEGMSSPIPELKDLPQILQDAFPEVTIVDLSKIKAHRVYDLLGILDHCKLLVTIDTVFLHLARAATCPVMAIVNDREPWRASVVPPATICQFGYKNVTTGSVAQAVGEFLSRPTPRVFHAASIFGQEERHLKAYQSWKKLIDRGMVGVYREKYDRDASSLGDRPLPYLKDVIQPALDRMEDHDVLVWTNDDVQLLPETLDWARNHAGTYGATSMRRDKDHIGRDLVAGTKSWWQKLPYDLLIGAHQFDLLLGALIRKQRGVTSTLKNMGTDFFPCEYRTLIRHEPHKESWSPDSPSGKHNAALFTQFLNDNNMKFWP